MINVNLIRNRGEVLSNAIVRFDNGETLGAFSLREDDSKLYIPQNGKDYAIVNASQEGELPVNFKAEKNGTYTLTVNVEGLDLAYLLLIDNMTGADIDLLQTPSYSFEAKTTDYESRFKLVFSANGEDGPSTGSETSGTLMVYPNPTNGILFVETRRVTSLPTEQEYRITNLMGQTLMQGHITDEIQQINIENLPAGLYFISVDDMTQKFVKQ